MNTPQPSEIKSIAGRLTKETKKRLGCSGYLAHMTVVYLDLHPYCFYCGYSLTFSSSTIEHLIGKAAEPAKVHKAKVLSCEPCNSGRTAQAAAGHQNMDLAEYLALPDRRMVDPDKAGFHFYRYMPQNAFEYIGLPIPRVVRPTTERDGRGWGLNA